ncbi:hypothetical protein CI102_6785 [Trichoderma harzianum]|nr:hypothetical protein CI102_6785 [Trichoderma harzianum]
MAEAQCLTMSVCEYMDEHSSLRPHVKSICQFNRNCYCQGQSQSQSRSGLVQIQYIRPIIAKGVNLKPSSMCATRETEDRGARWTPAPHYSSAQFQFVCAVQHGMGWPLQPEQQHFPPCLEKRRLYMFERERVPNSAGRKKKRTKSPANATGGNGPWGDEALIQSYSLPNLFLQGSHSAIQVSPPARSPATRGPEPPRYRRYRALPEDCDSSAVLQQLLQTTPDTSDLLQSAAALASPRRRRIRRRASQELTKKQALTA